MGELLVASHLKLMELRTELQGDRGRTEDASVAG